MEQMTIKERKWLESLKRCLKKKPDSVEILVQEESNNERGLTSEIHLMKTGVINESQDEVGDLLKYSPDDYSLAHITCDGVAANNHGY